MAVYASAQASDTNGSNIPIDSSLYKAAISHEQKAVDFSELGKNLDRVTKGGLNTVLHVASAAGNLPFIQQILRLNLPPGFVEKANVNGNTALHEAAEGGHYEVVELLLHHGSLGNVRNNHGQTPLFKACEGGHLKIVWKLLEVDASKLHDKSADCGTCLHAVVNGGHEGLLRYLLTYIEKNLEQEWSNLLEAIDGQGNTVLHIAARRDRLCMVTLLLERAAYLSYSVNNDGETAICVALKLGFLRIVEALVNSRPESIEIASKNGKNILHLVAELSQVKILKFLVENVDLSRLINQKDNTHSQGQKDGNRSGSEAAKTQGEQDGNKTGGDTPLHIAARNKNVHVVQWLLKVSGVKKDAVNSDGLTPLDIARENTEYHESYKIIEKLSTYPQGCRPFLYNTPTMSPLKRKKAVEIVDSVFAEKRNVDLLVAALLATMTFTAVFTVPGGFYTDPNDKDSGNQNTYRYVLGMPVLIRYDSFKVFLIFDCVAFFLSLFVVLMWEMTSPLNTGDKMLFMCVTSGVLCLAFGFTAYGLMAAVYSVLASPKLLAWIVLGSSMFIALCGTLAFFYMAAKFMLTRARFHNLCGVPRLLDDKAENIWVKAETYGILDVFRSSEDKVRGIVSGNSDAKPVSRKG